MDATPRRALARRGEALRADDRARRLAALLRSPWPWLALIAAGAIALGVSYVLEIVGYFVMPDELTYQRGALYIADHWGPIPSGNEYHNSLSQLAPLLLAPVWAIVGPIGRVLDGAHIANVVAFSSSCVPVFLLSRRIGVAQLPALLAAGAAVFVPWLAMAGSLMTEPIAYPAFCWALLGIHRAVSEPGVRGDVLGLLGVGLAVFARSQLAFMAVVLVAAVAVRETLAIRDGARAALARHPLLVVGTLAAIAYLLVSGRSVASLLGHYSVTAQGDLLPPGTFAYARELTTSAALACAGVTLPLAAGWALGALRMPTPGGAFAGALVLVLAGVAVVVVAGSFSVRFTAGQNDRYVAYLAPILFVGSAAAVSLGTRLVPTLLAGAGALWLYWTSTLSLQGPSLVSPSSGFRTVIDGRSRQLADLVGIADPRPTRMVAVLVALGLAAILVAAWRLPRALVAATVTAGVLAFGVAQTAYTLDKIGQTQQAASPEYIASRGWADRALPAGQQLNALIGFTSDPGATIANWWDAVFFNREVRGVYLLPGTPPREQPYRMAAVDADAGVLRGIPAGYLLVASSPVHVGLRDAPAVASNGPISLVRVAADPALAFVLQTASGEGSIPVGSSAALRVFGEAAQTVTLTVVAHGGPLDLAVVDEAGRRIASARLAVDAPRQVVVPVRPTAGAPALSTIRVLVPRGGAAEGATAQVLGVGVAPPG